MKKILVPHGRLTTLSAKTGVSKVTCSRFLKGYFDENDEKINERAKYVRDLALAMGGVIEQ